MPLDEGDTKWRYILSFPQILVESVLSGVAAAFAWVAFWTVIVPEVTTGRVWAGHEALIVPMFFLGLVGGPLALLLIKR